MSGLSYVLISIVRDEEPFLPETIRSVVSQSRLPLGWFVLDDGSADRTAAILADAAAAHSWIRVTTDARRERRSAGEATSNGFNRLAADALRLAPGAIVKIDGDMSFEPDYFDRLLREMEADPRLGIVGGRALEPHRNGSWGLVRIPAYHVHGATKVYRAECLEQIGPLVSGPGWDTADIIRARLAGWTTRSLADVRFRHLRVTGKAAGRLRNLWVKGRAAYRLGYSPLFALARALRNMVRVPYVLGGVAFLMGFASGYGASETRLLGPEEIVRFRRQQMRALLGRRSWWTE